MIRRGVNRTALLFGPWALKLPSFRNGARYFVSGMLGNLLEAERWQATHHQQLAEVLTCGPLGLWLVMRRYRQVVTRRLTVEERATLPFIGIDDNGANIALEGGQLVLLDYGNIDWYLDVSV